MNQTPSSTLVAPPELLLEDEELELLDELELLLEELELATAAPLEELDELELDELDELELDEPELVGTLVGPEEDLPPDPQPVKRQARKKADTDKDFIFAPCDGEVSAKAGRGIQ